jgi:hypothetical protein
MKPNGYWFTSPKFELEPGEDEEINPGIYGRQLARWLKERLAERGYGVEEIINEDWGRALMCSRDPFVLWVGCASLTDDDLAGTEGAGEAPPPAKEDIVWHCFATAEVFFVKRWLRKIDTQPAVAKLDHDLGEILRAEPEITLVPEP